MEFLEGLSEEQAIKYMINWIDSNPKFEKSTGWTLGIHIPYQYV